MPVRAEEKRVAVTPHPWSPRGAEGDTGQI